MRQYLPMLTLEECMAKLGGKQVFELKENVTPAIFPCQKNYAKVLNEEKSKVNLDELVDEFFKNNSNPNDDMLHDFAEKNKVSPHDLETAIYKTLSNFITGKAFKHGDDSDDKFDPEQLAAGIKVEKEHTDSELIAKAIAKSHLSEDPEYYIKLATIEKK